MVEVTEAIARIRAVPMYEARCSCEPPGHERGCRGSVRVEDAFEFANKDDEMAVAEYLHKHPAALTTAQAEIEALRMFREAALEAKALQEECAALCLPHEDEIHQLGVWLFDRLRDFRAALAGEQP